MPEIKKREIAYKLRISELVAGKPIFENAENSQRFKFLELGDRKIIRVNVIGNVVDKYESEGEKRYSTITLDDASGQIALKTFGDDTQKLKDIMQGHTVSIIGVLRSFNNEVYILPELVRQIDPRYLLVRKLEIEKSMPKPEVKPQEITAIKDKIIEMIKQAEASEGMETEKIILDLHSSPDLINQEIRRLLEEGIIYEPRPGKLRYLG